MSEFENLYGGRYYGRNQVGACEGAVTLWIRMPTARRECITHVWTRVCGGHVVFYPATDRYFPADPDDPNRATDKNPGGVYGEWKMSFNFDSYTVDDNEGWDSPRLLTWREAREEYQGEAIDTLARMEIDIRTRATKNAAEIPLLYRDLLASGEIYSLKP